MVDLAVAVADGETTISDITVLADQDALFGAVASDSTCWRLVDRLNEGRLAAAAAARARAWELVWAQHAEVHDEPFAPVRVAGAGLHVVRDLGA